MNWNSLGSVKLLIVEDDTFNRQLIVSLLAKYIEVEVIEAKNGLEAISELSKTDIDIILLDIYMPEMNGFEVLEEIKKDEKLSHIPIFILSSDEVERKKSLKLGADSFITKPFNLKELEIKIYETLSYEKC